MKRTWSELVELLAAPRLRARPFAVGGVGECSIDEVFLVEALPQPGDKIAARQRLSLGGGQVATAMVAASRLGLRAAFAGVIGDDAAGSEIRRGLRDEAVDTGGLLVAPGLESRSAAIFVEPSGERTIVERRDRRLGEAVLQPPAAAILHVDATVSEATCRNVVAAQADGALLSIDVEAPTPIGQALVAAADLAVVSEHYLRGRGPLAEATRQLDAATRGLVVVTRGAAGCLVVRGGQIVELPSVSVEAIDTTACGDTFRGALLAALWEGQREDRGLTFAAAAAALKCRDYGRRGCPRRGDVVRLLEP